MSMERIYLMHCVLIKYLPTNLVQRIKDKYVFVIWFINTDQIIALSESQEFDSIIGMILS